KTATHLFVNLEAGPHDGIALGLVGDVRHPRTPVSILRNNHHRSQITKHEIHEEAKRDRGFLPPTFLANPPQKTALPVLLQSSRPITKTPDVFPFFVSFVCSVVISTVRRQTVA